MSLVHSYDGADVTGAVEIKTEKGFRAQAELGAVETITIEVEDPGGARDFKPYKTWRIRETTAPAGNQTVWFGVVGDESESWGAGDVIFPAEPGIVWSLEVHEANHYLSRRLLRGFNRKAETVTARVTGLLAHTVIAGVIVDHGLVAASSVMMDPVDYTQRNALAVLQDAALVAGFGFHLRRRDASSDLELIFLNFETSDLDDSGVVISTDPGDGGYAPFDGYKRKRGASRISSGILVPYSGGTYYAEEPATATEFGPVDQVAPTPSVKTKAAAVALTTRLLVQHATRDERITDLKIQVPAANVNDLQKGQLLQAKLPRFSGWTELRSARALIRGVSRPEGEPIDRYDLDLELVPVDPVVTVATFAQLQGVNRDGTGPDVYNLAWFNNGNAPDSNHAPAPITGLIAYEGDFGLEATGTGTLNVLLLCDVALVASGTYTASFQVLKNGVMVLSQAHITTGGGLRFESWATAPLIGAVDVVPGDILKVRYTDSNPAGGINTFPAGVDATHLTVSGSLVA